MLPAHLKFWFKDLRRQLPAPSRESLDRLALQLRDKTRQSFPADPLIAFTGELDVSSPSFFSAPLRKAVAFYAVCALADPDTRREFPRPHNFSVMLPDLPSGSPLGDDEQLGGLNLIGSAAQATDDDLTLISDLLRTQYDLAMPIAGGLKL